MADPADLAGDNDTEVSAGSLDELLVTDGVRCVDELIPDPLFQTEKATKKVESVKNAIPPTQIRGLGAARFETIPSSRCHRCLRQLITINLVQVFAGWKSR